MGDKRDWGEKEEMKTKEKKVDKECGGVGGEKSEEEEKEREGMKKKKKSKTEEEEKEREEMKK